MLRRLAVLGALLLLGGVGSGCDLTGSRQDTSTPAAPDASDTENVGINVTHITVGEGTVTFKVLVPDGPTGCAGKPQAEVVGYDAKEVTVVTVVPSSLARSCSGSVARSFTTPLDLQGRQLVVNGVRYQLDGAGTSVQVCDGSLGCNPPENRCDPEWTSRVIPHYDLPPSKRTKVVACYPHWLILDVTATARSGGVQHLRWFAELTDERTWLVVATTRTGGCVDVRLAVPSFPVKYCRNLTPPT